MIAERYTRAHAVLFSSGGVSPEGHPYDTDVAADVSLNDSVSFSSQTDFKVAFLFPWEPSSALICRSTTSHTRFWLSSLCALQWQSSKLSQGTIPLDSYAIKGRSQKVSAAMPRRRQMLLYGKRWISIHIKSVRPSLLQQPNWLKSGISIGSSMLVVL